MMGVLGIPFEIVTAKQSTLSIPTPSRRVYKTPAHLFPSSPFPIRSLSSDRITLLIFRSPENPNSIVTVGLSRCRPDLILRTKFTSPVEPGGKRKVREGEMCVTVIWNVIKACHCSDDRSLPSQIMDSFTGSFDDIPYRVFTEIDNDDIGVVDEMITLTGRLINIYRGVPFDEVNGLVHSIRRVVDKAYWSGRRPDKLYATVTVKNGTGLPLEEYQAVLAAKKEEEPE